MNKIILNHKFKFLLFILFIGITRLNAQKVENLHFEQSGKQIIIYYDLTITTPDQTFDVQVFCSTDGGKTFGQALTKVSGDVGSNQTGGSGKKIVWDVLNEVVELEGEIQFEVRILDTTKFGTIRDDRDGQIYKTVKIGTQVWMAENMNYKTENGRTYVYINDPSNLAVYGRLYNWKAAKHACPAGWHLSKDVEWSVLIISLGGESVAGSKLNRTGESGFNAFSGGRMDLSGSFNFIDYEGYWWTSTGNLAGFAWYRTINGSSNSLGRGNTAGERNFFSVRCIKD